MRAMRFSADFLFRKMHVTVDMILAEAVVTYTSRAVTELQRGIVRVGSAADRTLSRIGLLPGLAIDAVPLPAEVDCGLAAVGAVPAEILGNVIPAEYNKVQYGNDRQQVQGERQRKYRQCKVQRIDNCQPLDLDRENEEQQNNLIRIEQGKGEEHGEIDVGGAEGNVDVKAQIHYKAVDNGKHHTKKII